MIHFFAHIKMKTSRKTKHSVLKTISGASPHRYEMDKTSNMLTCGAYSSLSLWFYSPSDLSRFFSFLIYTQSIGLLGRGINLLQGLYLYTGHHKHKINAHGHPCF
jgi:hypothetical protein